MKLSKISALSLSTGLDDHCDAVDRLLKTQRQSAKVLIYVTYINTYFLYKRLYELN